MENKALKWTLLPQLKNKIMLHFITRPLFTAFICFSFVLSSCQYQVKKKDKYLGLAPPQNLPEVFAPEVVSTKKHREYGITVSPQGDEIFFTRNFDEKSSKIMHMRLKSNKWTEPEAFLDKHQYYSDPFLHEKNRLYFISTITTDSLASKTDSDIYYILRKNNTWQKELLKPQSINSQKEEYFVSLDKNQNLYYASNKTNHHNTSNDFELFYFDAQTGSDNHIPELGSPAYDDDPFIAADGSFIMFASSRKGGKGSVDIYLSVKNGTQWSSPVPLENQVNTEKSEFCPYITPDGDYFFYYSDGNIYWANANIIYDLVKKQKAKLKID